MLFHLRDAFRAGDVWLARSRCYGDIRKALLSAPAVADADRSLPVPASPHDWLAERRFALDEGLRRLAAAARAGATTGGSIEDSVLRVERTETAGPDGAADLVADLYRRLPEARITDILLEVDDATRFTEAFTHLRTGEPCRDCIGLRNVLLAEGINLGLRKMAEATTTPRVLGGDAHRPLARGRRRVRPSVGRRRRGPGRATDGRLMGYRWWPESWLINWGPQLSYGRNWNFDRVLEDENTGVGLNFDFARSIRFSADLQQDMERFGGIDFRKTQVSVNGGVSSSRAFSVNVQLSPPPRGLLRLGQSVARVRRHRPVQRHGAAPRPPELATRGR